MDSPLLPGARSKTKYIFISMIACVGLIVCCVSFRGVAAQEYLAVLGPKADTSTAAAASSLISANLAKGVVAAKLAAAAAAKRAADPDVRCLNLLPRRRKLTSFPLSFLVDQSSAYYKNTMATMIKTLDKKTNKLAAHMPVGDASTSGHGSTAAVGDANRSWASYGGGDGKAIKGLKMKQATQRLQLKNKKLSPAEIASLKNKIHGEEATERLLRNQVAASRAFLIPSHRENRAQFFLGGCRTTGQCTVRR